MAQPNSLCSDLILYALFLFMLGLLGGLLLLHSELSWDAFCTNPVFHVLFAQLHLRTAAAPAQIIINAVHAKSKRKRFPSTPSSILKESQLWNRKTVIKLLKNWLAEAISMVPMSVKDQMLPPLRIQYLVLAIKLYRTQAPIVGLEDSMIEDFYRTFVPNRSNQTHFLSIICLNETLLKNKPFFELKTDPDVCLDWSTY